MWAQPHSLFTAFSQPIHPPPNTCRCAEAQADTLILMSLQEPESNPTGFLSSDPADERRPEHCGQAVASKATCLHMTVPSSSRQMAFPAPLSGQSPVSTPSPRPRPPVSTAHIQSVVTRCQMSISSTRPAFASLPANLTCRPSPGTHHLMAGLLQQAPNEPSCFQTLQPAWGC